MLALERVPAVQQRDWAPTPGVVEYEFSDHVEQLDRHRYDPLAIRLRRCDHQQCDDLAVRSLELADRQVRQFQQLLMADAGQP